MDNITYKQIYRVIGAVFGVITLGFLYVAYYANQVEYNHPAIYFMLGLASLITLVISIALFRQAGRTDN